MLFLRGRKTMGVLKTHLCGNNPFLLKFYKTILKLLGILFFFKIIKCYLGTKIILLLVVKSKSIYQGLFEPCSSCAKYSFTKLATIQLTV